jgi:hypothetical protein
MKYVNSHIIAEKKEHRKRILGPTIIAFIIGLVPGLILKGKWLFLSVLMISIAIIALISVFIISSKPYGLKKSLLLDFITCVAWITEISFSETVIFTMWKGFHVSLILLYLPVIIIPLLVAIKTYKVLKKNSEYNPKQILHSKVRINGMFFGIVGMNFAIIFKDAEQNIAIVAFLICFTFLNCVMSMGLLTVQKLYYISKYNMTEI